MALVVQKYGGSSVQDADRIKKVAERIVRTHKEGNDVVVVVSAMGDTTDELLDLAEQVSPARRRARWTCSSPRASASPTRWSRWPSTRWGCRRARSPARRPGWSPRPSTATPASCRSTRTASATRSPRARSSWSPGFQGVSQDSKDVTTLGRGGSDTTAVALAAALDADVCEIYTDVDGIFSADPRIVPDAQRLASITYEEMLEMAACGAKVLHLRAVEYARRYGVPLRVRSSYNDKPGSLVTGSIEEIPLENAIITGVAHDRSEAKITVVGVPDTPGMAARIFRTVADADINIDMVLQNISRTGETFTDITFTLPKVDGPRAVTALTGVQREIGFAEIVHDDEVGKVSLIGAGMRNHPGVTATFCEALSQAGINIETMNTSEIRISVICRVDQLDTAVGALHNAFDLGGGERAVVHAGTGR